jgi:hypothetical protein
LFSTQAVTARCGSYLVTATCPFANHKFDRMFMFHPIVTLVHVGNKDCLGAAAATSWIATMRVCDSPSNREPSTVFVQAGRAFASVEADNSSNCACFWLTGSKSNNGYVRVEHWTPGLSQWVPVGQ